MSWNPDGKRIVEFAMIQRPIRTGIASTSAAVFLLVSVISLSLSGCGHTFDGSSVKDTGTYALDM